MRPYDWLAMYRGRERLRELPRTYAEIHRRSLLRSRTFYWKTGPQLCHRSKQT